MFWVMTARSLPSRDVYKRQQLHGLHAVLGLCHLVALKLRVFPDQRPDLFLIVHHQDTVHIPTPFLKFFSVEKSILPFCEPWVKVSGKGPCRFQYSPARRFFQALGPFLPKNPLLTFH